MNYYRNINHSKFTIDFASSNKIDPLLLEEISLHNSKYFQLPRRKHLFRYFFALLLKCRGYDIIHVHANSATAAIELWAAKLARIHKRIIHIHTSKTEHPLIHKILYPLFKQAYTEKIACSIKAGEWIFDTFKVLPNAINCSKFIYKANIRDNYRNQLGFKKDDIVIGHIGKFMNAKNHLFLIDIYNEILKIESHSKLLLIGDGYLRNQIESKINRLGLNDKVKLVGMRKDIPELLQAMDIFVFPSLWEGLPLSVLEAQASGLTCILSDTVTTEVALSDEIYYYSLKENATKWANLITKHFHKMCNREIVSNRAIEQITQKGYNIKQSAEKLTKLYES